MRRLAPFYFVTDPHHQDGAGRSLIEGVSDALAGGASLIQYREKQATRARMYETARTLREVTESHHAVLIINDQVDLALAVGADGVHLGQDDLPVWAARKVLGPRAIVGRSTHSLLQARQAQVDGADYIGFGPIFKTPTKPSSIVPLGIAAIADIKREVALPLYAIGGIQFSHLSEIMAAGADGVAVISGVAGEMKAEVAKWVFTLDAWLRSRGLSDETLP